MKKFLATWLLRILGSDAVVVLLSAVFAVAIVEIIFAIGRWLF